MKTPEKESRVKWDNAQGNPLSSKEALERMAGKMARLGAWTLHVRAGILEWTEQTRAIHEVPDDYEPKLEEAIGFYPENQREFISERVSRCIESGEPFNFESPLVTAKGRRIWVHAMGEAVRDEDGEIAFLQGAVQDISLQKEALRTAAAMERRLRDQSEAMPCIVWTAEPDGTVNYANHHLLEYTGLSPETDPATRWQTLIHPDDLHACTESWECAIQTGEPYKAEYRIRRHDGAYRWFVVLANPYFDNDGEIVLWYGTATDIHDRHKVEQEKECLLVDLGKRIKEQQALYDVAAILRNKARTLEEILQAAADRLPGGLRFPGAAAARIRYGDCEVISKAYAPSDLRLLKELSNGEDNVGLVELLYVDEIDTPEAEPFLPEEVVWLESICELIELSLKRWADQKSLEASEARFRLLSKATTDAIWDWDLTTDAVWWNEGIEQLFGFSRAEIEPDSSSWTKRIHPEDAQRVTDGIHAAIRQEDQEDWGDEYRFRCRDGSYAYVLDRGYIIRDSGGCAVRMIGGMTDLTSRKATEEKLREQAALLDKAQDAILVRDLEHQILYWNESAERLYGWSREEAVGRSIKELLYDDPKDFLTATETCLREGEWLGELNQKTANGEALLVEGRWSLVRDDAGNPKSILAINTDITERRKLEKQFFRAQRMESIGTLAGGIAHDLNNLLSPIVMGVGLLRHFALNPKEKGIIDAIERSARRGSDLVKQVLSFARGIEGSRASIDLTALVNEIEAIIETSFPKNITFEKQMADDLWPVFADATQINQVLLNFCVNARDAMGNGGRITMTVSNMEVDAQYASALPTAHPGRFVVVEVADEGCGMSREVLDRVFEPFYTTKEMGEGTGLGLSTSAGIIRSHGGFINAYSELGRGSVFKVYLPVAEGEEYELNAEENANTFPRGRGECVLVVDDENSILAMTKQTLETFGYSVLTAEDGAHGLALFLQHRERVSVVLTDMMMPVMDGPALIRALRRVDATLPIIGASGLNANGLVTKAARAGVGQFIEKPYSTPVLLKVLNEVLRASGETQVNWVI